MDFDYEATTEAAYGAYAQAVGGKTWDGRDMPTWAAISATPQGNAWRAATKVAADLGASIMAEEAIKVISDIVK